MLQHIVLQGDSDLRELEFATADALRGLMAEGLPRFVPLGIRNRRSGQEIRAFWSLPDHACGVRLVRDMEMGVILASVECTNDDLGARVVDALSEALPSVSVATIMANEDSFERMPELVFLLALAARHAPSDGVVSRIKRLLSTPSETLLISVAGAAAVLGGQHFLEELRSAATRRDLTPAALSVLESCIGDVEGRASKWDRQEPFTSPEEVFSVRW